MNNLTNLYLLVRFARTFVDPGNSAFFIFDNDHDGAFLENGDDVLGINPAIGLLDNVRSNLPPCPFTTPGFCEFFDTDLGGTKDGAGAFHNSGTFTVYEFAHPLNSGDTGQDFSLAPGDTVGFLLDLVRLISANNTIADTQFPLNGSGDIVIASPSLRVAIDVKPGGVPNSINPGSNGVISVAILTTGTFSASRVDWTTVRFGPTGTEAAAVSAALEDVDGDGDTDMILHFRTQGTGLQCGEINVSLTGQTFDRQVIEGSDSISTVGCKSESVNRRNR